MPSRPIFCSVVAYLTKHLDANSFYSCSNRANDTNRSRRPVHPYWQVIQGAFLALTLPSLDLQPLQRQCKHKENMRRALAAVAGYASTTEAWRRGYADEQGVSDSEIEPDISDTFHFLYENVLACSEEIGREFGKIVQKKRVLYRLEV